MAATRKLNTTAGALKPKRCSESRTGRMAAARESMHKGRVLVDLIDSDSEDENQAEAFERLAEQFDEHQNQDDERLTLQTARVVAAAEPQKHPLLAYRIDSAYKKMYEDLPKADVIVVIEEGWSAANNFTRPIQFGVIAARAFSPGEVVTFYGGKPMPQDVIRNTGIAAPLSHACRIKGVDDALDGRPFAMMIRRPVPGSDAVLGRLINNGVEALMPKLSDGIYTKKEIRRFYRSPFGYLINRPGPGQKANVKLVYKNLDALGLRQMPWLVAKVPIRAHESLLWNYNNHEVPDPIPDIPLSVAASREEQWLSAVLAQRRDSQRQAQQGAMLELARHMSRIQVQPRSHEQQPQRKRLIKMR